MSDFKGRHFEGEIVLWAVRWYCRYGVSYRDLEQMMGERGVTIEHSTIYRWVQRYAPEIEKRLRWQWRGPRSTSWRIDETYIKVRGQWAYLYRAVDKHGNTIDFYLSPTRSTAAGQALPRQSVERPRRLGEAERHQHRQGADLRRCSRRAEAGGEVSGGVAGHCCQG
jgi:transposase-like protein